MVKSTAGLVQVTTVLQKPVPPDTSTHVLRSRDILAGAGLKVRLQLRGKRKNSERYGHSLPLFKGKNKPICSSEEGEVLFKIFVSLPVTYRYMFIGAKDGEKKTGSATLSVPRTGK